MSLFDTDEWELGCFLEWRPKHKMVDCSCCGGSGEVGGGFKSLDGARQCPECHGSRYETVYPKSRSPEIPAGIREHMRRAWYDFNKGK